MAAMRCSGETSKLSPQRSLSPEAAEEQSVADEDGRRRSWRRSWRSLSGRLRRSRSGRRQEEQEVPQQQSTADVDVAVKDEQEMPLEQNSRVGDVSGDESDDAEEEVADDDGAEEEEEGAEEVTSPSVTVTDDQSKAPKVKKRRSRKSLSLRLSWRRKRSQRNAEAAREMSTDAKSAGSASPPVRRRASGGKRNRRKAGDGADGCQSAPSACKLYRCEEQADGKRLWVLLPEDAAVVLLAAPLDELSHLELEALRTFALPKLAKILPQQTLENLHEHNHPLRSSLGFLKNLMADRRSTSTLRRNATSSVSDSGTGCFGLPIDVARNNDRKRFASVTLMVPYIVQSTVGYLKENGPTCNGIFRVSGSSRRVRMLHDAFEAGEVAEYSAMAASDVASVLKSYLRALPEPLLMRHLYAAWADVPGLHDETMQIEALRLLCSLLPDDHRRVLQQLLDMLHTIAVHANAEDGSQMTSYNLALVMAPNILRPDAKTEKLMRTMSIERAPASASPAAVHTDDRDTPPPLEREIEACEVVRLLIDHHAKLFVITAAMRDELLYFHMRSSQNLVGALLRAYCGRGQHLLPPSPPQTPSSSVRPRRGSLGATSSTAAAVAGDGDVRGLRSSLCSVFNAATDDSEAFSPRASAAEPSGLCTSTSAGDAALTTKAPHMPTPLETAAALKGVPSGPLAPPAYPGTPSQRHGPQSALATPPRSADDALSAQTRAETQSPQSSQSFSPRATPACLKSSPGRPVRTPPSRTSFEALWDTQLQPSLLDELARAWDNAMGRASPASAHVSCSEATGDEGSRPASAAAAARRHNLRDVARNAPTRADTLTIVRTSTIPSVHSSNGNESNRDARTASGQSSSENVVLQQQPHLQRQGSCLSSTNALPAPLVVPPPPPAALLKRDEQAGSADGLAPLRPPSRTSVVSGSVSLRAGSSSSRGSSTRRTYRLSATDDDIDANGRQLRRKTSSSFV